MVLLNNILTHFVKIEMKTSNEFLIFNTLNMLDYSDTNYKDQQYHAHLTKSIFYS